MRTILFVALFALFAQPVLAHGLHPAAENEAAHAGHHVIGALFYLGVAVAVGIAAGVGFARKGRRS